jgi:hypothetical protein
MAHPQHGHNPWEHSTQRPRPPLKPPPTTALNEHRALHGQSTTLEEHSGKQQEDIVPEAMPRPTDTAPSTFTGAMPTTSFPHHPPPLPIPPEPPPDQDNETAPTATDPPQETDDNTEGTEPAAWEVETHTRRVLTEEEEIEAAKQEELRRTQLKPYVGWDLVPEKAPNPTRVGFINLQHLSHHRNDSRSRFLIDQMRHYKVNVLMMCEPNVQMHRLEAYHNWYERSSKTLGPQSFIFANNRQDSHNKALKQMGGTAIVAMLETKTRVLTKGEDPHKLGQWAWMLIQGRHGHHTLMVSVYRPNKNLTTAGTVYRQQLCHWRNNNNFECPLKLFDEHLEEEIKATGCCSEIM